MVGVIAGKRMAGLKLGSLLQHIARLLGGRPWPTTAKYVQGLPASLQADIPVLARRGRV